MLRAARRAVFVGCIAQGLFAEQVSATSPAKTPVNTSTSAIPEMHLDTEHAALLVRSTLMSVHDANISGNYSVVLDLGSPDFQKNKASDLAIRLQKLRERKIDLAAAAMSALQFNSITISPDGKRARLVGRFETRPESVHFDINFERIGSEWRLSGIGVALVAQPAGFR